MKAQTCVVYFVFNDKFREFLEKNEDAKSKAISIARDSVIRIAESADCKLLDMIITTEGVSARMECPSNR